MYIKLYEEWLNEAEIINKNTFDIIISKEMQFNNKRVDDNLNKLSQYGLFPNEIREAIKQNKSKYSDSLWSNLGTASGVENAINTFKMMFAEMVKSSKNKSFRRNFETVMNLTLNTSGMFTFDDKLAKSTEAIELVNIIKNGNKKYANEIGFYFAMFDVACAVTNGLYYISGQLPITMGYTLADKVTIFKNIKEIIDQKSNKVKDYKGLITLGRKAFSLPVRTEKTIYHDLGSGISIPAVDMSDPVETHYVYSVENFVEFVNNFSISNLQQQFQIRIDVSYDTLTLPVPGTIFGILYVGNYYNNIGLSILQRAIGFMEQGGANWYQKLIG